MGARRGPGDDEEDEARAGATADGEGGMGGGGYPMTRDGPAPAPRFGIRQPDPLSLLPSSALEAARASSVGFLFPFESHNHRMRLQMKETSAKTAEDAFMAIRAQSAQKNRSRAPTSFGRSRGGPSTAAMGKQGAEAMRIAAGWHEPVPLEDAPGITIKTIALPSGALLRIPLSDHRMAVQRDGRGLLQEALEVVGPEGRLLEDGSVGSGSGSGSGSRGAGTPAGAAAGLGDGRVSTPVQRIGGDRGGGRLALTDGVHGEHDHHAREQGLIESGVPGETPRLRAGALVVTGPGALVPSEPSSARGTGAAGGLLAQDSQVSAQLVPVHGAPAGARRRFGENPPPATEGDPRLPEHPHASETAMTALHNARSAEHTRRIATGAIPDAGAMLLSRARAALQTPSGLVREGTRAPAAVSRLAAEEKAILRAARQALRNHQLNG